VANKVKQSKTKRKLKGSQPVDHAEEVPAELQGI
jgi:hypothetical protein